MNFVRLGIATLLSLFAVSDSNAADPPYRIGVVYDASGPGGVSGRGMRRGVELAIAERGGKVNGRNIQVVWEDDSGKSQVAVQKVTEMLASKIDLLLGPSFSSSALAVMSAVAAAKVPQLLTVAQDDRITGANKTRYTLRTSAPLSQDISMISDLLKSGQTKKVYAVVTDIAVLRDAFKKIRDEVAAGGVRVIGEDFLSLDTKDWSVPLDKISRSDADSVLFLTPTSSLISFLKQAHEVGLPKKFKIVGPFIDEFAAKAIGPGVEGVLTTAHYHPAIDNPANKKFVEAFTKAYNEEPSAYAGDTYDGVSWWLDTVQKVGGTDNEKIIDAFQKDVREQSIKGQMKMRACDNQAEQGGVIGVGVKRPSGEYGISLKEIVPASKFPSCS